MVRLLCFSDIHGNVDAVKAMVKDVQHRSVVYDAAIFAGDFTNQIFEHDMARSQRCYDETVELVSGICGRFFYIFGNRDRPQKNFRLNPKGTLIDRGERYELGKGIQITATPELIGEKTIYVEHNPSVSNQYGHLALGRSDMYQVYKRALLDIAGHTHKGLFTGNFLNTGFLYRDGAHGDEPMPGGYCDVQITGTEVKVQFHSIGPLREKLLNVNGYEGIQFVIEEIYDLEVIFA